MGYGRSFPTMFVPVTIVCANCGVTVTIQVDAGKDYIFEDTVREAELLMIGHCNWMVPHRSGDDVLCSSCRPPDVLTR